MVKVKWLDRFRDVFDWFLLAYAIVIAFTIRSIDMVSDYRYFITIFFILLIVYLIIMRAVPFIRRML